MVKVLEPMRPRTDLCAVTVLPMLHMKYCTQSLQCNSYPQDNVSLSSMLMLCLASQAGSRGYMVPVPVQAVVVTDPFLWTERLHPSRACWTGTMAAARAKYWASSESRVAGHIFGGRSAKACDWMAGNLSARVILKLHRDWASRTGIVTNSSPTTAASVC
eukprot:1509240-Rhodomonas_salina.2